MTRLDWRHDTRSHNFGAIHTFTSPIWPNGGHPGDVQYARISPATGWTLLVAGEPNAAGHLESVELAEVLRRTPPDLHVVFLAAHEEIGIACGKLAQTWIDRRQRYRRELKAVAGG